MSNCLSKWWQGYCTCTCTSVDCTFPGYRANVYVAALHLHKLLTIISLVRWLISGGLHVHWLHSGTDWHWHCFPNVCTLGLYGQYSMSGMILCNKQTRTRMNLQRNGGNTTDLILCRLRPQATLRLKWKQT